MSEDSPVRVARWDGRDLAAIQVATALLPRVHGRPAAEVDGPEWGRLTVCGTTVPAGFVVVVNGSKVRVLPSLDSSQAIG
jgi:hypothetical protein